MPSNVTTANFMSPAAIVAPDVAVQQQQLARRQALADQLRQQSLEETPSNGGAVSYTQGLAKMLSGYLAGHEQKKIDTQQAGLGRQYATAMRGMFGGEPAPAAASGSDPKAIAAALQTSSPDPAPVSAQDTPAASSPAPSGATSPGPWSLSGNPGQDYASYLLDPDAYGKAVVAAHAPTDFSRQLTQAGIDPNGALGRQIQQTNIAKQNYTAPVNGRPGSTIRDPYDPSKVIGYDAPNIEGAFPVYGANGMPTGYQQAPGAAGAIGAAAGAKAGAQAAFSPAQVFNPATGQMEFTNQAAVTQGAPGPGGAPSGGRYAAGPGLGAEAAYNVTGKNSAGTFQTISDGAADVPNRLYALKQMQGIVADPKSVFGPGSDHWNKITGTLATLSGGTAPSTTNAQEFGKWASQYSARSAQDLGLSGSDARVQIAIHATPNGEMTKDALRSVIPQMMGLENAKQGYANAAVNWQQQHGPQTAQQFRTEWNKVYDPQVFTLMAQGPQAFAGAVKRMSPAQAAGFRAKYLQLKQIGALGQ